MKTNVWKLSALALLLMLSWSCSREEPILPDIPEPGTLSGFYLLNEGTMDQNNATLDYCNLYTGIYYQDVYTRFNPDATLGLGDTGNDVKLYGSKLYAVINKSNKVVIMHAANAVRVNEITISQPRFITFSGGKAYVTAWDGTSLEEGTANGMVVEIDTATMAITRSVLVGHSPEDLAVVGNRLYVANSVVYDTDFTPTYDNTLSVIDLSSFKVVGNIEVAVNLKWVKPDAYGNLYVSSLGNYGDVPANLYVVDTKTETVAKSFDIPVSNLCVAGDSVYVLGSSYDAEWKPTYSYHLINGKNQNILPGGFIKDGSETSIKTPYGIAVDPKTKNVYVTDAADYASPGTLYGFNRLGQKVFSVPTGVAPAHFAFVYW